MKEKILFDYFMDGIHNAAKGLYDLHPLVCKEFSSADVIKLFRQFESKVCEKDPFWMKSNKIMFINGDGKLETLDIQNEVYFILNADYRTDRAEDFINNSTMHASFCPSTEQHPLFESYECYYKGKGICLKYLNISHRLFKHYGENFFMRYVRPHTEIFKEIIVDIFGLKKFPEDTIKMNQLEDIESSIDYALKNDDYPYFVEKAEEYVTLAKDVCPELENDPTCKEIIELKSDISKIIDRADTLREPLNTIIEKVKKSF